MAEYQNGKINLFLELIEDFIHNGIGCRSQRGTKMTKKKKKSKRRTDDNRNKAFDALEQIIGLLNDFCRHHLNEEYFKLCEELAWESFEEDLPLEKGLPAGWASGIVHAIGFVNFLQDPSQSPHMTSAQIAGGFGVSQQTMQTKSKIIRDNLDIMQFDPDWCLPSLLGDNPLVWMLEIDGIVIDARYAPLEFQREAYRLGLIPYIPGEDSPDEPEPQSGTGTKIIEFPSKRNNTPASKPAQKAKDDEVSLFDYSKE